MLDKVITIDPGINLGWAWWNGTIQPRTGCVEWRGGRLDEGETGIRYVMNTASGLEQLITSLPTRLVVVEGVEVWSGSLKSETSAHKGDLIWLSYLIGSFVRVCFDYEIRIRIVPASVWKGQLTKEAVKARIKRINGLTYANDHITDAVGIGMWLDGRIECIHV